MRIYSKNEKSIPMTGDGLVNSLIDKLPIELHIPKVGIASLFFSFFALLIMNHSILLSTNIVDLVPSYLND